MENVAFIFTLSHYFKNHDTFWYILYKKYPTDNLYINYINIYKIYNLYILHRNVDLYP